MSERIVHRGPDGDGLLLWAPGDDLRVNRPPAGGTGRPEVGLAHRRLSIIDLRPENDQPFVVDGLALAYNGELYNYIELREELAGLGHGFRTIGDTEVVIRAYQQWGPECVRRFVGMWALALLDTGRRRLWLSRDRFGIKPLFLARVGSGWAFASEIKALLAVPGLQVEPNPGVVAKFLASGVVDDGAETFFTGIERLPAAHNLVVESDFAGEPRVERYWHLEDHREVALSDPVAQFREALFESVRVHARSDVAVGSCLSGGLDSSTIVSIAERLRADGAVPRYGHHVFGYVPPDVELSEEPYMRLVAEQTGADLTVVAPPMDDVLDAVPAIVEHQDEPFGTSSIAAQWFVFDAARRAGVKVMLDGQGADEVLAGYHSVFPYMAVFLARRRSLGRLARLYSAHRRVYGRWPLPPEQAAAYFAPMAGRAARFAAERRPRRTVASPPVPETVSPFTGAVEVDRAPLDPRVVSPSDLGELLRGQIESSSLPSLLRFEDRNSMAHSIEARVPFLDHRVVELASALDERLLVDGVTTKRILREAMDGVLPEPVRTRTDKLGFRASPQITWKTGVARRAELDENVGEFEERWFAPGAVTALLDRSERTDADEATLWRMINTKLWLRRHWPGR